MIKIRSFRVIASAGALAGSVPAAAQVMQIDDVGNVTTQNGPVITLSNGSTALDKGVSTSRRFKVAAGDDAVRRLPLASATSGIFRSVAIGELNSLFETAARESGVDAHLLRAVAWQESRFRHQSVSAKGAIGIMQLMPSTAQNLGIDPRDLLQNLRGGARLLSQLLRQYQGNLDLTLAAYNAGPESVRRWGGVPPFAETRNYVQSIRSALVF